ncbi:hypothetical protein CMUS01_01751 [Colletotrichum musicola]|uniref:Uncharacterized protein n=1 Tax=Colletotrichum musicola TaxID=2175873 RepID=A0A8H6U873_9PEZI|nr:hypothetical protein CMUS01_01751 [Colletotrichum musicola]
MAFKQRGSYLWTNSGVVASEMPAARTRVCSTHLGHELELGEAARRRCDSKSSPREGRPASPSSTYDGGRCGSAWSS